LEAGSHLRSPLVPGRTRRTGMSPGRALVPYGCACTPAVDNACTTPRTMTTGPASVCGISGPHAVQDDEKSRKKKRVHWLAPPIVPHTRVPNSRHCAEVPPSKGDSQFCAFDNLWITPIVAPSGGFRNGQLQFTYYR